MSDAAAAERRYYRDLGARVRAARNAAGLNQDALAKTAGITRSSIANLEAGRQRIPVHVLARIAEAFGTTPAALLPIRSISEQVDDYFNLDAPLAELDEDARAFITGALDES